MTSSSGRASPTQSSGIMSALNNARLAFWGSSLKMTPKEALAKLAGKIQAYESGYGVPDFEWLDGVNRFLWILTSEGDFLLEREKDRENILSILSLASTLYFDHGYKSRNCLKYAKNDPRKSDITYEEILLQVQGRCTILENLYINVHSADSTIKELKLQLRGTSEEENRLSQKLKNTSAIASSIEGVYQNKLEELRAQFLKQLDEIQAENKELTERLKSTKSEDNLLRLENQSLHQRNYQLSSRVIELERELAAEKQLLHSTQAEDIVTEIEMPNKELSEKIQNLTQENIKLHDQVEALSQDCQDLLAKIECDNKKDIREKQQFEDVDLVTKKFTNLVLVIKEADAAFKANYNHPEAHGETLYTLLGKSDEIIKK